MEAGDAEDGDFRFFEDHEGEEGGLDEEAEDTLLLRLYTGEFDRKAVETPEPAKQGEAAAEAKHKSRKRKLAFSSDEGESMDEADAAPSKNKRVRRYWDELDESLICYNCGKPGHISMECIEERKMTCYGCGQDGHAKAECPNARRCHRCDQPGHFARECNAPTCYRCGEVGHLSRDCTGRSRDRYDRNGDRYERDRYDRERYDRDRDRRSREYDDDGERGSDMLHTRYDSSERKHIKFDEKNGDDIQIRHIDDEEEEEGEIKGKEKEEKKKAYGLTFGSIGGSLRGMTGAVSSVIRNFKAMIHPKSSTLSCYNCGEKGHQGEMCGLPKMDEMRAVVTKRPPRERKQVGEWIVNGRSSQDEYDQGSTFRSKASGNKKRKLEAAEERRAMKRAKKEERLAVKEKQRKVKQKKRKSTDRPKSSKSDKDAPLRLERIVTIT